MASITKYGVCYNLHDSPYNLEYSGYKFYFSTYTNEKKFIEKARIKELWLTDSLSRRFHFNVDASLIAIFQLYNQIENRGFYVVAVTGQEFESLDDVHIKAVM